MSVRYVAQSTRLVTASHMDTPVDYNHRDKTLRHVSIRFLATVEAHVQRKTLAWLALQTAPWASNSALVRCARSHFQEGNHRSGICRQSNLIQDSDSGVDCACFAQHHMQKSQTLDISSLPFASGETIQKMHFSPNFRHSVSTRDHPHSVSTRDHSHCVRN